MCIPEGGGNMRASIVKWGNSQGVRLPKTLLESVALSEDDEVELVAEGDRIVIKKANRPTRHRTIQERFEGFTGIYESPEIDWGEPAGREIW